MTGIIMKTKSGDTTKKKRGDTTMIEQHRISMDTMMGGVINRMHPTTIEGTMTIVAAMEIAIEVEMITLKDTTVELWMNTIQMKEITTEGRVGERAPEEGLVVHIMNLIQTTMIRTRTTIGVEGGQESMTTMIMKDQVVRFPRLKSVIRHQDHDGFLRSL